MGNIVSPTNPTKWVNLSKALEYIPAQRNIMGDLGLFDGEFLNTDTVVIPKTVTKDYIMPMVPWGTRVKNTQPNEKERLTLSIPHHAVEDAIKPLDIRGKIDWDELNMAQGVVPETLQKVIDRRMVTAKRTVANTWSTLMMYLVRDGSAVDPANPSSVVTNYYTQFGVTRSDMNLDVTEVNDPAVSIQAAIDNIQDNFKGGFVPTSFIALLSRDLFDALKRHPQIIDHLGRNGKGTQSVEILTANLGTQGYNLKKEYQVIEYCGVTFIRCQTSEIPAGEGRMFPTDVPDMFKIFFAPSDKDFNTVNETAQDAYFFTKLSDDNDEFKIIYETNPLVATLWPKALIRLVGVGL
jgi:hypothetical protein